MQSTLQSRESTESYEPGSESFADPLQDNTVRRFVVRTQEAKKYTPWVGEMWSLGSNRLCSHLGFKTIILQGLALEKFIY